MTVTELIERLQTYPPDYKVVMDTSCDYENYNEATRVTPGHYYRRSSGGGIFYMDGTHDSVLIK